MREDLRTCPLGHTCASCRWLVRLRGNNPQTGEEIDMDDCAVAFLPVLLVENSQQQRSTGAAIESFRNAMLDDNVRLLARMTVDDLR